MKANKIRKMNTEYANKLENMERDSLVSSIAVELATSRKFDNVIEESVKKMHHYFDADRTNLCDYNTLTGIYSILSEYKKEGVSSFADLLASQDSDVVKIMPDIHAKLANNEIVPDANVNEKAVNKYYQGESSRDDIKSMMMVPIFAHQKLWGYVAFIYTKENRKWMPQDIAMCRRIMTLFSNALEQKRTKQGKVSTAQILRTILDHVPSAIFWKDASLDYLGCNRSYE